MDTRLSYQNIIKRVLQEHAEFRSRGVDPVKSYPVFDDQHGRYLIIDRGWEPKQYWHANPIHLEVIDDKIWIQQDETEDGIAIDLLGAGVPKEDIVLGFRPPHLRKYTGFASIESP